MNSRLKGRLLKHADSGMMFHYLDSLNRQALGDPLLKRSEPSWNGHIVFSAVMLVLTLVLLACGAPV